MSQDESLREISNKLSAVLLVLLSPELAKQNAAAKVELLARTGISNQEIATILGTTKGTVEVLKSRSNRKRK
jgi:DNA-binding CsgD family transcriptional regulator